MGSVFIFVGAEKFVGSANDGGTKTRVIKDCSDSSNDFTIRNMSAVPSHEEIDIVPGSDSDVSCVGGGFRRNDAGGKNTVREVEDGLVNFKKRDVLQNRKAFVSRRRVARARFVDHELGNSEVIVVAAGFPPTASDLLLSRKNEVIRRPSG